MSESVATAETEAEQALTRWMPIAGKWDISREKLEYLEPDDPSYQIGIALSDLRATRGSFRAKVKLTDVDEGCAQFVLGHDSEQLTGYAVGIGGFGRAYSISEYFVQRGSRAVFAVGAKENLQADREYEIEVHLRGQSVRLLVDRVEVLERTLPHPLLGDQVGVKGYGQKPVVIWSVTATPFRPRAFVVMQFSEPFDSLWQEVIRPVAKKVGFDAFRADDVFRPGIILQDIVRGIVTSDVIIAEVTPRNPNVFYELGYAHALAKPTVLLAEEPHEGSAALPFDISGFRCIFYDDAIRGKRKVETALERHLRNIYQRNNAGEGAE